VRSPKSIHLNDLNGDGKLDMLILIPREPARIFLQKNEGFSEIATLSSVRKSLLNDLDSSKMGFGDIDGDGKDELLVVGDGFMRSVQIKNQDELEIVDQYNSKSSEDKIKTPLVLDIDNDGALDIVFYDEQQGSLQVLKKESDGVYRYNNSIEVGKIDPLFARTKSKDGHSTHMLYFGKDSFWSIPLAGDAWDVQSISTYETELQNAIYNLIEIGDLNNDGIKDILLIDGQNHMMEVLTWNEKESWASRIHYTVFDQNMHYAGMKGAALEPREALIADFTNDGLDDIAILVHDRILIYPQIMKE
jgi:hypothetical protein